MSSLQIPAGRHTQNLQCPTLTRYVSSACSSARRKETESREERAGVGVCFNGDYVTKLVHGKTKTRRSKEYLSGLPASSEAGRIASS